MDVQWILIGEIVAPQGNKGEVKVVPHTDFPERFSAMDSIRVFRPHSSDDHVVYALENCRFHKGCIILKLAGVDSITDAEKLRGLEIRVGRNELVELPPGQNFVFDLIGLRVVSDDGQLLGEVIDVLKTGANDVYVVSPRPGLTDHKEIYIPVTNEVVQNVDVENGQIIVHLLDGLLE